MVSTYTGMLPILIVLFYGGLTFLAVWAVIRTVTALHRMSQSFAQINRTLEEIRDRLGR